MSEILAIIITIAGLISTCSGLILTFRNIKKTSPSAELKTWQAETDAKLDNDNRRLNHLEKSFDKMEELDRIMLRSVKGILGHLSTGNHTEVMNKQIKEIDNYLISK